MYTIIQGDQVEVIDFNSKVASLVHENYYKRNRHRLIPTEEYYIKDPDSANLLINEERVKEALSLRDKKEPKKVLKKKKKE